MGQTKAVMDLPESWEIVLNKFGQDGGFGGQDVDAAYSEDLAHGTGPSGLASLDIVAFSDQSVV